MFKERDESDTESEGGESTDQNEFSEEIIRDPLETDMDWQYEDQPFQSEVKNVDDSQSRNTVT